MLGVCSSGNGAEGQNRTADTTIFSRVLYRLSYLGTSGAGCCELASGTTYRNGLRPVVSIKIPHTAMDAQPARAMAPSRGTGPALLRPLRDGRAPEVHAGWPRPPGGAPRRILLYLRTMLRSALCIVALLVTFEKPAGAYLDPGTGSMLLQVLLGGVAAVGVISRLYWHRLTAVFAKLQRSKR